MNVIWLLFKASWISVVAAIAAGLVSGACSASLIALINQVISQSSSQALITPFSALALLGLIAGILSQFLLINLAQGATY